MASVPPDASVSQLSRFLRIKRSEMGFSVAEMAAKTGIGKSVIYRIERGETVKIQARNVERLAACLGVSPKEIFELQAAPLPRDPAGRDNLLAKCMLDLLSQWLSTNDWQLRVTCAARVSQCAEQFVKATTEASRENYVLWTYRPDDGTRVSRSYGA